MTNFDRCVEAKLSGISIGSDRKLITLSLCDTSGTHFSLLANGVSRFLANELRETNIVDRVSIWHNDNWSSHSQELLEELVAGSQDRGAMEAVIASEVRSIQGGQNILVEIEPVYGASVLVLCEQFAATE